MTRMRQYKYILLRKKIAIVIMRLMSRILYTVVNIYVNFVHEKHNLYLLRLSILQDYNMIDLTTTKCKN